jgi:membrane protease YdiL (CAAX protease family)
VTGSASAVCSQCGIANTKWRRDLLLTWYGASFLGLGSVFAYFVFGQIVPGIVAAVAITLEKGPGTPPEQIEAAMIPYLPGIVGFGAFVAVVMVALLHLGRVLPPNPTLPASAWTTGYAGLGKASAGWRRMAWFVGLTVVCLLGQQAIAWVQAQLGVEAQEQEVLVQAATQSGPIFFFAVAIGAPVAEELVFRRILFAGLARLNRPVAWGVATVVFALVHFNFPALLLYVWMALCFTLAYERTGSVWGAIGVHAVNNGVAVAFFE